METWKRLGRASRKSASFERIKRIPLVVACDLLQIKFVASRATKSIGSSPLWNEEKGLSSSLGGGSRLSYRVACCLLACW